MTPKAYGTVREGSQASGARNAARPSAYGGAKGKQLTIGHRGNPMRAARQVSTRFQHTGSHAKVMLLTQLHPTGNVNR